MKTDITVRLAIADHIPSQIFRTFRPRREKIWKNGALQHGCSTAAPTDLVQNKYDSSDHHPREPSFPSFHKLWKLGCASHHSRLIDSYANALIYYPNSNSLYTSA